MIKISAERRLGGSPRRNQIDPGSGGAAAAGVVEAPGRGHDLPIPDDADGGGQAGGAAGIGDLRSAVQEYIDQPFLHGLRVPPHAVVEAEDTYEGGAVGIKTMMTGGSLPELLVFASDIMAIGAAHQMQKEGIRIPQEVGLICFGLGERQQAQYCTPPLSVIEMPTEAMTAGAVQMAAEMIRKGANAAVVRSYEPVVIFRESFSL